VVTLYIAKKNQIKFKKKAIRWSAARDKIFLDTTFRCLSAPANSLV